MKAYKQKSGRWYVRCYDKVTKEKCTVYGDTEKMAIRNGAAWYLNHRTCSNKTFGDVYDEYLASKKPTISSTTYRDYSWYKTKYLEPLCRYQIDRIDNSILADFFGDLISKTSVKTGKNVYGAVIGCLRYNNPETTLHYKFPKYIMSETFIPSESEFAELLKDVEGKDMEIPIKLAAFCSLRRGEICALRYPEDFDGNEINIRQSMAITKEGTWILKSTKTKNGLRTVYCPDDLLNLIKARGYVYKGNPYSMTRKMKRIAKRLKIPRLSMHSLRRYFASATHARGIPDRYIQEWGGWGDANTMRRHYQKTIKEEDLRQKQKWVDAINEMINPVRKTENEESL